MPDWQVDIEDMADTPVVTNLPFKSMTCTWVINSPGVVEIDLDGYDTAFDSDDLAPARRQIAVYHDSDYVWGGYLWTNRVTVQQNREISLTIIGEGFYSILRSRVVTSDLIYEDTNIQQVMWNLIDHSQDKTGGDVGITQGIHSGANIQVDREYCALEYPNIATSIEELSKLDDGSDWVITPTRQFHTRKVFRTFEPRRMNDATATVLGQNKNSRISYDVNGLAVTNYVYNVGLDDCNPPVYEAIDTGSRGTYKLRESVEDVQSAKQRDLEAHGNAILRNYKNPVWTAQATYWEGNGPAWGDFDVGDKITFSSSTGFADFSKVMRVTAMSVTISPPEVDFWTITLDEVID